ncbi:MAG: NAD(P)/FAD-dependent oxidoreductase [Haloarculaceae archaeon]
MERVAIVGAGAAGAATAFALRDAAVDVTVFEARQTPSGRAATRHRDGCTYDCGANYVRGGDERVAELVTGTLDDDGLVDVAAPVWTFDAAGTVGEGDDRDDHKWTWEQGIDQFARRLLDRADAAVRYRTRVVGLDRTADSRWRVRETDGAAAGAFDAVVATPPAPRTADLLAASDWDDPLRERLVAAARGVPFRGIYSVLLHYPFELDRPWYALVNTDHEHEIGWLSREECKRGHVPPGESLLVVQMAPDWSADRDVAAARGDPAHCPASVTADAAALTADLLDDERLASPDWTDCAAWQYALPDGGPDADLLRAVESHGLYCAGDWVTGDGRVHLAAGTGLAVGERVRAAARDQGRST